jgi:peptidyl-prolyl cis-trans isomerase SurA
MILSTAFIFDEANQSQEGRARIFMGVGMIGQFSRLSLVVVILLWSFQLRAGTVFEEVVARVNNDIITKSDYEKARDLIRRELQRNVSGPEMEKALSFQEKNLLKQMIDDQLLVQKAIDLNLNADNDVIKFLDNIRREQKLSDMEALEKVMVQQGIDPTEFKTNIKNNSLKQQVLGREVFYRLQQVSQDEITKYYDAHKEEFDRAEEVRIQEILISTEGKKPNELPDLEKKAQETLQKAKSGERFDELAKKYSDGPTAKDGGDLGFFPRGKMRKEIEDVAFKLRRGQISDLIKTDYGYVIIKLAEKHDAGIQKIEIVEDEIREKIVSSKAPAAIQEYMKKLRSQAFIKVSPGYEDTGFVPNVTVADSKQAAQNQSKKEKKKTK